MTDVTIRGKTAERLADIARRQNRPVEAVIEALLNRYETSEHDSQGKQDETWRREFRSKLYQKARIYWQQTANQERLALTDEQLDEEFWLIDHEGIPRLKSDQDTVDLPVDPLEAIDSLLADSELRDMSTTVHRVRELQSKPDVLKPC